MMAPGQLVTDWMQAENLLPFLELGDLVEFRRVVGIAKRRIYTHWGVYIGSHDDKAYITHTGTDFGDFGGPVSSSAQSLTTIKTKMTGRHQIQVRCDELSIVAQGDSCRINNSLDRERRPFPPAIVVNRALLMLGSSNYNILWNNCEHFANYCRYDLRESSQAELAMTFIICSATFCLTGSLPAAALAGLVHYAFGRVKPYVPPYKR